MKINYESGSSLEIVFKVQETCNINCSYCYMYNMGNEAHKVVPQKQATDATWERVADFIIEENRSRNPRYVRLVFHGGEPMLIKPRVFQRRLSALWKKVSESATVQQTARMQLSIQTNGTMVSPDWKDLLRQWKISTGVSIDGPKSIHDRRRVDKHDNGTHERAVSGLRSLAEDEEIRKRGLGVLCVIDPEADGAAVYRYLVNELGVTGFNFLLPFMNWDSYDPEAVAGVSQFLVAAFREWCSDIRAGQVRNVRIFLELVQSFKKLTYKKWQHEIDISHDVIVVECDGTIMTEESLRPTFSGLFSTLKVGHSTLSDIRASPQFAQVASDTFEFAKECDGCALLYACRSGGAIGRVGLRYSSKDETVRKSVYCDAFINLYAELAAFLRTNHATLPTVDLHNLETLG